MCLKNRIGDEGHYGRWHLSVPTLYTGGSLVIRETAAKGFANALATHGIKASVRVKKL